MLGLYGIRKGLLALLTYFGLLAYGQDAELLQRFGRKEGILPTVPGQMLEGPDGLLWVATEGQGVYSWDGWNARTVNGLGNHFVSSMAFWGDSVLLLATDKGLYAFQKQPERLRLIKSDLPFPFYVFVLNQEVVLLDSEGRLNLYPTALQKPVQLPMRFVQHFSQNPNQLCISGDTGVFLVEVHSGIIKYAYLSSNKSALWTYYQGQWVNHSHLKRDSKPNVPAKFRSFVSGENGLLAIDEKGFWIGKDSSSLSHLDLNFKPNAALLGRQGAWVAGEGHLTYLPWNGRINKIELAAFYESTAYLNNGSSVFFANDKLLWQEVGGVVSGTTPHNGGYVFALAQNNITKHLYLATESGLLECNQGRCKTIKVLEEDPFVFDVFWKSDSLWAVLADGVWCKHSKGAFTLPINGIKSIFKSGNTLWLSAFDGRLGQWSAKKGLKWADIDTENGEANWLKGAEEMVFKIHSNGKLNRLKRGSNRWEEWNMPLPESGRLLKASISKSGRLALLSENHILIGNWKPDGRWQTQEVLVLGLDYAADQVEALELSWLPDSTLLVFEGSKRLYIKTKHKYQIPTPLIRQLDLGRPNDNCFDRPGFMGKINRFELPYSSSYLRIGLGYRAQEDPMRWQFMYVLYDRQNRIVVSQTGKQAVFPVIPPGQYRFEAFALDPFTMARSQPIELIFSVRPPFWLNAGFWLLVFLVLLILVYWLLKRRIKQIEQKAKTERELSKLEGMALRLQMNPHFIFNALDSISSFILKNEQDRAIRYLSSFARLIRSTLESSHESLIPLRTELDILRAYLELERMRSGEQMAFELVCDEYLQDELLIPPMLVQPYVENAVKHGLKPLKTAGKVEVRFELDAEFLRVEIEDNGVGRAKARELAEQRPMFTKGKSMSMGITEQRLRLLKKSLGQEIKIEIIDKFTEQGLAAGTLVKLYLAKIEDE